MTWRVAQSLETLLAEVNAAAPHRSTASDGSIGDASHSSRESDHNPNEAGVVRARDFTHDPDGGLDCNLLATSLEEAYHAGGNPALGSGAYTIWNRRILSRDRLSEGWRPYTGTNAHDHHLHQSVATARAGYDSTRPWGVMERKDEIDMATTQELRKVVADVVDAKLKPIVRRLDRMRDVMRGRHERILRELDEILSDEQADTTAILGKLRGVRQEIAGVRAELEQVDE